MALGGLELCAPYILNKFFEGLVDLLVDAWIGLDRYAQNKICGVQGFGTMCLYRP